MQEVEYELETFSAFVIRVGYVVVARGEVGEVGHHDDFTLVFECGREAHEVATVGFVHSDNEVEVFEIGFGNLPAAVCEVVTASASMDAHALVGELPDVVVACAGAVDDESAAETCFVGNGFHDSFGGRGTADVAQTHEKYSYFLFVFKRVNKLYCFMVYVVVYHFIFLLDEVGHLN